MAGAWSFVALFQTSETQGASDTESERQPSLDQRFLKNVCARRTLSKQPVNRHGDTSADCAWITADAEVILRDPIAAVTSRLPTTRELALSFCCRASRDGLIS